MTYNLEFKKDALKEWKKLPQPIKDQFKKKLEKVLENPHVPANRLSGFDLTDCYKIKLRSSGYRLVYTVQNKILTVTVVAVGKRDKNAVYQKAHKRV